MEIGNFGIFNYVPCTTYLIKKMFSGSFNNKIVFTKVKLTSSKHFGTKSSYWIILELGETIKYKSV